MPSLQTSLASTEITLLFNSILNYKDKAKDVHVKLQPECYKTLFKSDSHSDVLKNQPRRKSAHSQY